MDINKIYIKSFGDELEKVALNALKARQLSKSVGIIPQPGSAWKWALRNLRAPRSSGSKIMSTGRELSNQKKKIGLLTNNQINSIKSTQRNLGGAGRYETGLTDTGKIIRGKFHGGLFYNPKKVGKMIAHTHPGALKLSYMSKIKNADPNIKEETKHMFNKTLSASPSSVDVKTMRKANQNQVILSKWTTGVHKLRPQGVRSTYFKGGF